MLSPDHYAYEKLGVAVERLDRPGPLVDRLRSAYASFHVLQPGDFSDPRLAATFAALREMLGRHEGAAGRTVATLARMSDGEAEAVERLIRELYAALGDSLR